MRACRRCGLRWWLLRVSEYMKPRTAPVIAPPQVRGRGVSPADCCKQHAAVAPLAARQPVSGQRESRRPRWLRVHAPTRMQVSAPETTSVSHLATSATGDSSTPAAPAARPPRRAKEGDPWRRELSDVVSMMVAPLLGGVPNPIRPRDRSALAKVMLGRLRVEGRITADAPAAGDHPTELRIKPANRPRRSGCIRPPTRRSTDPEAYA
jgi:hypothetical protein